MKDPHLLNHLIPDERCHNKLSLANFSGNRAHRGIPEQVTQFISSLMDQTHTFKINYLVIYLYINIQMNDPNIFHDFIHDVAGVTNQHAINAITGFITTFQDLLSTNDNEINAFVQNTHSSNSARTRNKISIPPGSVISLQAILFELKDRQRCGALPTAEMLQAITAPQLALLKQSRSNAIEQKKNRAANTLPSMTVPKFNGNNYDEFMTSFTTLANRQIGLNDLPLDYLMRENEPQPYDGFYTSREDKMRSCLLFQGDNFRVDRESLYSLFIEHIGTTGTGSSIVNKFKINRNGYLCFQEFKSHFANATYLQNKATTANAAITAACYLGVRRNFTIETYYTIMSNAFNNLTLAGPAHILSEPQKITKFEAGLKEDNALKFAITAKTEWDRLPLEQQTFDKFYNIFSASMSKYNTLIDRPAQSYGPRRISNLNTHEGGRGRFGRGGRGRGGRGRGRGGRGGRGRGRGRGGRYNNYYSNPIAPIYGNFTPEAKIYPPETYRNLTYEQKKAVGELKTAQQWIDASTPPAGFTVDMQTGYATPSNAIISAMRTASINNTNILPPAPHGPPPSIIHLPPPPAPIAPLPPNSNIHENAGINFGRSGSRNRDSATVSTVSINGQAYQGQVYDRNGNVLN